jgi:WD40 repeat protein
MLRRIAPLLLSIAFFMASCQTIRIPVATDTANLPAATVQTDVPSATPEIAPSSTPTPESEAEPIRTDLPAVSGAVPQCFTSSTEASPFAFMPDNVSILIRERSGVRIFNLKTMEEESFLQAPQELLSAALSPDGEILAWSLADNTIQLIRIADQKLLNTLEGHTLPVQKLRFSPTGDRLFSASMDTWVRIWDRNGEPLDAFEPTGADDLPNEIMGIGISPDGTKLGSIPFDGPAKVWGLAEKNEIVNLGGTGGDVTSDFAFSPDGQFVAADQAGRLSLWRTSDWTQVFTGVFSLAFNFSPNGRFLAYSDVDDNNNVILRPLAGTQKTRILEGHQTFIYELFFSPDGALLASAGAGIQIWQVESGQLSYVGKTTCP